MHRTEWRCSLIDTAVESRSWLTGLVLHRVWRTCGRWMGERKTRAIALGGDSTMKSWEICTMSRAMNYPQATGIRPSGRDWRSVNRKPAMGRASCHYMMISEAHHPRKKAG